MWFNNVNCEHYTVSVINDLMSVEHWWSDNDSGNGTNRREKSVPVPLCVAKSHTGWPGIEPTPSQWQKGDCLSHGTTLLECHKVTSHVGPIL